MGKRSHREQTVGEMAREAVRLWRRSRPCVALEERDLAVLEEIVRGHMAILYRRAHDRGRRKDAWRLRLVNDPEYAQALTDITGDTARRLVRKYRLDQVGPLRGRRRHA